MKFIFICPIKIEVFESADFSILENRGVITDATGKKTLDAKVELEKPCPLCGGIHIYPADELSCPFTGTDRIEEDASDGRN